LTSEREKREKSCNEKINKVKKGKNSKKEKSKQKENFGPTMDLTTIDDEDDVEATEDIISFHSSVRENIVSSTFYLEFYQIWIYGSLSQP
jgi:hypothetical protein